MNAHLLFFITILSCFFLARTATSTTVKTSPRSTTTGWLIASLFNKTTSSVDVILYDVQTGDAAVYQKHLQEDTEYEIESTEIDQSYKQIYILMRSKEEHLMLKFEYTPPNHISFLSMIHPLRFSSAQDIAPPFHIVASGFDYIRTKLYVYLAFTSNRKTEEQQHGDGIYQIDTDSGLISLVMELPSETSGCSVRTSTYVTKMERFFCYNPQNGLFFQLNPIEKTIDSISLNLTTITAALKDEPLPVTLAPDALSRTLYLGKAGSIVTKCQPDIHHFSQTICKQTQVSLESYETYFFADRGLVFRIRDGFAEGYLPSSARRAFRSVHRLQPPMKFNSHQNYDNDVL